MDAFTYTDPTLLEDIQTFMRRFVIFQDEMYYDLFPLWILHTHTFQLNIPYATPYLYVNSAEKQSGKTRTMEVTELFTHQSMVVGGLSTGAMYAAISSRRPTLFIDEVDTIFTGAANEELRGMLNSGYKKNGQIARQIMTAEGRDVEFYSTFCPKLLAGINNGAMPDTIADRCIMVNLKRKKVSETVERLNERKIMPEVEALRTRIKAWVKANGDRLVDLEPAVIDTISDRAFEIAEPLLAIGMLFQGWTEKSRQVINHVLSVSVPKLSLNATCLLMARELLGEDRDIITSAELAAALEISPKRLGLLLASYDITPGTKRIAPGQTAKGYYRKDFQDAWERYLPAS